VTNDSRPALNLGSILLAIVIIAGLGIYLPLHLSYRADGEVASDKSVNSDKSQNSNSTSPAPAVVAKTVAATKPSASYSADVASAEAVAEPASAQSIQEPVATASPSLPGESPSAPEVQQSSWEAPFDAAYWNSSGWKFDAEGMTCSGDESSALFRRTYVHFMFECQIEPLADVREPLRVRLKGRQSNTVMTLAIDGARLVVTDDSREGATVIKAESISPGPAAGSPGCLKLAATGNRLIVTWNGTTALTCNQTAGPSGRAIRFEFAAGRTPWRIRDLRIEGE